jgi:hypothetical protein
MQQTCAQCNGGFEVTEADLRFYEKVSPVIGGKMLSVPPPTFCPPCRQQRRISWRNERNLRAGTCGLCKKKIVSVYGSDAPFPVYCNDCWWSDKWDAKDFGRSYDKTRPFLEQIGELQRVVPRNALYLKNAVNSDYCNHSLDLKNCYLCACIGGVSENGLYSKWILKTRDFVDSYQLVDCELCYESMYSNACYNCIGVIKSQECRDSAFLYDCTGCSDCFQCWNLRHKKYHIQNVEYSEAEYRRRRAAINLGRHAVFSDARAEFLRLIRDRAINQAQFNRQCEESSGDFLVRCKNVCASFDVEDAQDSAYCYGCGGIKDCFDINEAAVNCELQCDAQSCDCGQRILFSHTSYYDSDMLYSDSCHSCHGITGCVGMRSVSNCILNMQYSEQEYETLVPVIVEAMRREGTWGEFFPTAMSPFAYNDTVAMEYFPLTQEDVHAKGWRWRTIVEEPSDVVRIIDACDVPDSIDDIPDDIVNWAIRSAASRRPYRIIRQELDFYRRMRIPIPRLHPDERYRVRMELRNPRKLWNRECMTCGKRVKTSFAPERPEKVFCEECYLKEVY